MRGGARACARDGCVCRGVSTAPLPLPPHTAAARLMHPPRIRSHHRSTAEAAKKHPKADVFVNYASFRR